VFILQSKNIEIEQLFPMVFLKQNEKVRELNVITRLKIASFSFSSPLSKLIYSSRSRFFSPHFKG